MMNDERRTWNLEPETWNLEPETMITFIHKVAEHIFTTHGEAMGEVSVVLPNRRAGLFFNRSVATLTDGPVWAPRVVDIRSFMEMLAGREVSDDLLLVKELYGVYKKVLGTDEPFEKFYPWGVMLLGDFDDIDKYLVDARDLFRNLKAVRDLSADLSYLTEEQIELIRRFWDHFPADGKGHAPLFLALWEKLNEIYVTFRETLKEKDLAYEGMIYREVAERFRRGDDGIDLPPVVYFVGFNALTPAEEILFRGMQTAGKAFFFWDYDIAYVERRKDVPLAGHDAGRFIAAYLKKFPPPVDLGIFDNLSRKDKKVEIWSSPNRTTQSWVVKQVLEAWGREGLPEAERVAVVLGDEQLLLPVLHALPESAGEVNVTMGYPLRSSPVYAFFSQALTLVKNRRTTGGKVFYYYHHDVLALLRNPLVRMQGGEKLIRWEKEIIRNNMIYIGSDDIHIGEPVSRIFTDPGGPIDYSATLLEVLYDLILSATPQEEEKPAVDLSLEVFYRLSLLVTRFNGFVTGESLQLSPEGYLSLLLHLAEKDSVSFYGEPLTGLQVMGVLETRLLDFDRLIILSANEGSLPKPASAASYIPYNLRKGFGLPAWEHRDSLFAYYFFRLIQRAREVVLVYHTESGQGITGEKSRFISQMQYFLGMGTRVKNLFFRPGISKREALVVEKDRDVIRKMISLYSAGKYLSPSALNSYLDCRLRFYFRYVAGIREADEITEDVDHALFGQLIHKALEILYDPAGSCVPAGGVVTAEVLKKMKEQHLEEAVDIAMRKVLSGGEGRREVPVAPLHRIIRSMVVSYVKKVLDYDRQLAPLTILGVEKEVCDPVSLTVGGDTVTVSLCGKIDRVDRTAAGVRVIDYKTGGRGAEKLSFGSLDELFDRQRSTRKKEIFQVMMYAMMYPGDDPPATVLYFLKDMFGTEALQQVRIGSGRSKEIYRFDRQEKQYFRDRITGLVEEIFDPAVPFDMTSREENCRYCPFKEICEKE